MNRSDIGAYAIVPEWVLRAVSTGALALYIELGLHANRDTGEAWPSKARIAERLGSDPRSIARWRAELEEAGAVRRSKRFADDGSQRSNLYEVVYAVPRGDTSVIGGWQDGQGGMTAVGEGGDDSLVTQNHNQYEPEPKNLENFVLATLSPQQEMFGLVCEGMGYDHTKLSAPDAADVGKVASALLARGLHPDEFSAYLAWLAGDSSPIVGGTRLTLHSLPKWVKDFKATPLIVSKSPNGMSAPGRTLAQAEELRRAGL